MTVTPPRTRVLERVEQQVLEDARDLGLVALDRKLARPFHLQIQPAVGGRRLRRGAEIAQ